MQIKVNALSPIRAESGNAPTAGYFDCAQYDKDVLKNPSQEIATLALAMT